MTKSKDDYLGELVLAAAIGRTTAETIEVVMREHSETLRTLWGDVVKNAVLNVLKNNKKRRAKLIVGQMDLFSPYNLPALVPDNNARGRNEKVTNALPSMTKTWLKEKIEQLERRPSRKEVELGELRKLLNDIDGFCGDDETIGDGLRRANGK